jgi:hypothetical protein
MQQPGKDWGKPAIIAHSGRVAKLPNRSRAKVILRAATAWTRAVTLPWCAHPWTPVERVVDPTACCISEFK